MYICILGSLDLNNQIFFLILQFLYDFTTNFIDKQIKHRLIFVYITIFVNLRKIPSKSNKC